MILFNIDVVAFGPLFIKKILNMVGVVAGVSDSMNIGCGWLVPYTASYSSF